MKCALTIQEKLKDLRTSRGLTLEQLAEQIGFSKSALGSYETDEYKEISHKAIIALARFYGVTSDYLLGLSENKDADLSEIAELHLDGETINILKTQKINIRLLCEVIKHPDFWKLMSDLEIYVDSIAAMAITTIDKYIAGMRSEIQNIYSASEEDFFMRTLKLCEVEEDDYFSRLLGLDITKIARDLKTNHQNDMETADANYDPVSECREYLKLINEAADAKKVVFNTAGKLLQMDLSKMTPYEINEFSQMIKRYSKTYKQIEKSSKVKRNRGRA